MTQIYHFTISVTLICTLHFRPTGTLYCSSRAGLFFQIFQTVSKHKTWLIGNEIGERGGDKNMPIPTFWHSVVSSQLIHCKHLTKSLTFCVVNNRSRQYPPRQYDGFYCWCFLTKLLFCPRKIIIIPVKRLIYEVFPKCPNFELWIKKFGLYNHLIIVV